jgi:ribose 5-phosphate isomerase B
MNIAVGSDHRGLDYKKYVIEVLSGMGHNARDLGTYTTDPFDYPDIAKTVGQAVANSQFEFGVLICGTGIGVSIAANKVKGIRAAVCCDTFSAGKARQHNNANILCLGADRGTSGVDEILKVFFTAQFEGGRHQRRVEKIAAMESSL